MFVDIHGAYGLIIVVVNMHDISFIITHSAKNNVNNISQLASDLLYITACNTTFMESILNVNMQFQSI